MLGIAKVIQKGTKDQIMYGLNGGTQQHIIKTNSQCGYEINASWDVHSRLLRLHSTLYWSLEAFRSGGGGKTRENQQR
jgi:hypothetical protein